MTNNKKISEPLDILIIGGGAMGLALAGMPHESSKITGLITRHRFVPSLLKNGFKLTDPVSGEPPRVIVPSKSFQIFSDINVESIFKLRDDATIIVAVKTPDLESVITDYFNRMVGLDGRAIITKSGSKIAILLVQNGLHPELRFKYLLAKHGCGVLAENVLGCVTIGTSQLDGPPNIGVVVSKCDFHIGGWEPGESSEHLAGREAQRLENAFNLACSACSQDQNAYRKLRYERAIIDSANSLSAMFNVRIGDLNDNLFLKHYLEKKMQEAIGVYNAGVEHDSLDPLSFVHSTVALNENILSDLYTSMAQDFLLKIEEPFGNLRTEVGDLDLTFAKLGHKHGLDVEYNEFFGYQTANFTNRFNQIRAESVDAAREFGRDFLDWNRVAVGLDPIFDADTSPDVLKEITVGDSRPDRLDILREIYTTLADRYTTIRS